MAWGLEARVPFLDKAFLDVAMNVDAVEKMFSKGASQEVDEDGRPRMEKVRQKKCDSRSFECQSQCLSTHSTFFVKHSIARRGERYVELITFSLACLSKSLLKPYLPHSILWRQKEQFSDGVGYSWIDGCVWILSSAMHRP